VQDPKKDVNVDEVLLTKTVAALKAYVRANSTILVSLSY